MLISWNWLQEYVILPEGIDVEQVAERLTMTGCEVEEIRYPCSELRGVVTAKVDELRKHPSADKLFVAELVMPGREAVCITAAPNLFPGDIVPYAPPGAVMADGTVLGEKDFSGVLSQGMMLSAEELGLPEIADEFGILRLPPKTKLGVDLKSHFGLDDVLLDISVTPNRGDLLSIIGLAREIYALFPGAKLKELPFPEELCDSSWREDFGNVTIKDNGCKCYALGMATDITISPTPVEVRIKLAFMGMRPISNVVDATNVVMLLTGQPLHAFDLELLPSRNIEVRSANENEHFVTLDEKEHVMSEGDLLITSNDEPIGIAGVMGGQNTEIRPETKTVVVESANFDSARVSQTSRRLGINSEAAYRYSRGVDPQKARSALFYALGLIAEWGGAEAYHSIKYSVAEDWIPVEVTLHSSALKRVLLWDDLDEASAILERLGLKEKERKNGYATFLVPSWRPDIGIEADLIEEVGRIRGYNNISPRLPANMQSVGDRGSFYRSSALIRDIARARGYTEVVTFSFIGPSFAEDLKLPEDDIRANPVPIANPMSMEQSLMRTVMLPGLLTSLGNSIRSGWRKPVKVFEIGRVFLRDSKMAQKGEHEEKERVAGLVFPGLDRRYPHDDSEEEDFFSVKGDVMTLFLAFGIRGDFIPGEQPFGHMGQTASIEEKGKNIGYLARLKPDILEKMDLPDPVFYFELDMDRMMEGSEVNFKMLSQFPKVFRDISILVSKGLDSRQVEKDIRSLSSGLLKEIRLFDVYTGKGIPEDFRSLAFSLAYCSDDRTLSDEEVDRIHNDLRESLSQKGYTLR
jgi:phenylalanyl-tRNA synthetase beta chain